MLICQTPCWLQGPNNLADSLNVRSPAYFSGCMSPKAFKMDYLSDQKTSPYLGQRVLCTGFYPSSLSHLQTSFQRLFVVNVFLYDLPNFVNRVEGKLATGLSIKHLDGRVSELSGRLHPCPAGVCLHISLVSAGICPAVNHSDPRNSKAISVL